MLTKIIDLRENIARKENLLILEDPSALSQAEVDALLNAADNMSSLSTETVYDKGTFLYNTRENILNIQKLLLGTASNSKDYLNFFELTVSKMNTYQEEVDSYFKIYELIIDFFTQNIQSTEEIKLLENIEMLINQDENHLHLLSPYTEPNIHLDENLIKNTYDEVVSLLNTSHDRKYKYLQKLLETMSFECPPLIEENSILKIFDTLFEAELHIANKFLIQHQLLMNSFQAINEINNLFNENEDNEEIDEDDLD